MRHAKTLCAGMGSLVVVISCVTSPVFGQAVVPHDHIPSPDENPLVAHFDMAINPVAQQPGIVFGYLDSTLHWHHLYFSEFNNTTKAWSAAELVFDTEDFPNSTVDQTQYDILNKAPISLAYMSDGTPAIACEVSTFDNTPTYWQYYHSLLYIARGGGGWSATVLETSPTTRHALICWNDARYQNVCLRFNRENKPWIACVKESYVETIPCTGPEIEIYHTVTPEVWTANPGWGIDWSFTLTHKEYTEEELVHGGISLAMDPDPATPSEQQPSIIWGYPGQPNPSGTLISTLMHYARRVGGQNWPTLADIPGGFPSLAYDPVTFAPSVAHHIFGVTGYYDGQYYTSSPGGVLFSSTQQVAYITDFAAVLSLGIDMYSRAYVMCEYTPELGTTKQALDVMFYDETLNNGAGGWAAHNFFQFSCGGRMVLDPGSGNPYVMSIDNLLPTVTQPPRIKCNCLDGDTGEPFSGGANVYAYAFDFEFNYDALGPYYDVDRFAVTTSSMDQRVITMIPPNQPGWFTRVYCSHSGYETSYVDVVLSPSGFVNAGTIYLSPKSGCSSPPARHGGTLTASVARVALPPVVVSLALVAWFVLRRRDSSTRV